jgi:small subunit ribosomal protein S9
MSTEETVPDSVEPAAPSAAELAIAALPEPPKNVTKANPYCTVGRRKSAQARARTWPGEGKTTVNGRTLENYFSLEVDRTTALRPFALTGALGKYDVMVTIRGGGATGQADAIALALARAIADLEPVTHRAMRDSGLLTRDARVKERKKYGRRGARRGFQFSKR